MLHEHMGVMLSRRATTQIWRLHNAVVHAIQEQETTEGGAHCYSIRATSTGYRWSWRGELERQPTAEK
jgi:hypothetical protein